MPGITVTISKPSADIALKYGPNVSKGIKEMERKLERYRKFVWGERFAGELE